MDCRFAPHASLITLDAVASAFGKQSGPAPTGARGGRAPAGCNAEPSTPRCAVVLRKEVDFFLASGKPSDRRLRDAMSGA